MCLCERRPALFSCIHFLIATLVPCPDSIHSNISWYVVYSYCKHRKHPFDHGAAVTRFGQSHCRRLLRLGAAPGRARPTPGASTSPLALCRRADKRGAILAENSSRGVKRPVSDQTLVHRRAESGRFSQDQQ